MPLDGDRAREFLDLGQQQIPLLDHSLRHTNGHAREGKRRALTLKLCSQGKTGTHLVVRRFRIWPVGLYHTGGLVNFGM